MDTSGDSQEAERDNDRTSFIIGGEIITLDDD
jgi:hypothetical protein